MLLTIEVGAQQLELIMNFSSSNSSTKATKLVSLASVMRPRRLGRLGLKDPSRPELKGAEDCDLVYALSHHRLEQAR